MGRRASPHATEAEFEILQVLWQRGPSAIREIHEVLDAVRPTRYTTISKLLQIMEQKEMVERDTSERIHVYEAAIMEADVQHEIVSHLVDRVFAGSAAKLVQRALAGSQASKEELEDHPGNLEQTQRGARMNLFDAFQAEPFWQALGWTLVHSIWQLGAIGVLVAGGLAASARRSADLRYLLGCLGMGASLVIPVVTFGLIYSAPSPALGLAAALENPSTASQALELGPLQSLLNLNLTSILGIWVTGVLVMVVWQGGGWIYLTYLGRRRAGLVGERWLETVDRWRLELGVKRDVQLRTASWISAPMVTGWVRPLILVPISTFSGLSAEQIEMIIVHELVHVRRHDYLVNLFQAVAETLFFYHPAVWWISHRIRTERENCCDDAVVAVLGDALGYAEALAKLETTPRSNVWLCLGGNGRKPAEPNRPSAWRVHSASTSALASRPCHSTLRRYPDPACPLVGK